jgi:hypothetical protein
VIFELLQQDVKFFSKMIQITFQIYQVKFIPNMIALFNDSNLQFLLFVFCHELSNLLLYKTCKIISLDLSSKN